ncbi:MAG: SMP-30/gluconolactonase/LRE family protein [Ilumatobacteraceae bacterium]
MSDINRVLDIRAELGECPVWSDRDRCLYWIDVDSQLVHRYDPELDHNDSRLLPGRPGSIALTRDADRLLVAMEHHLVDLTWSTGTVTPRVRLEAESAPTRLNDGRADPAGRFWVGSMDIPAYNGQKAGTLFRVGPNGIGEAIKSGVGVSNGLAFSPDGSVMYWADTTRDLVWAYDYDAGSGERRNGRVFLDFANLPGRPDGACIDEAGCYWVACVYGWSLLRATPAGEVDRIIELPVEKPSMPAFGGSNLDTIYLTSISTGGSVPLAPGQPWAGGLLTFEPGVKGLAEPLFAG